MKVLKVIGYLFCIGCLAYVLVMASGCATVPDDVTHGVLVSSWWESLDGKKDFWLWDNVTHMCQYKDGTIINAGRKPCP